MIIPNVDKKKFKEAEKNLYETTFKKHNEGKTCLCKFCTKLYQKYLRENDRES